MTRLLVEWPGHPEWPAINIGPIPPGTPAQLPSWLPAEGAQYTLLVEENEPMKTVHDIIERLLNPIRITPEEEAVAKDILNAARAAEKALTAPCEPAGAEQPAGTPLEGTGTPAAEEAPAPGIIA